MNEALGWIGKIAEFLGRLFPRLLIIEATHQGVAFKRGKHVISLTSGLHVYWPLWTIVVTAPTVRQTVKLPTQALTTKDGKRVAVGGMVRYKVRNVTKALAETWDLDGAITDESLVVLSDLVASKDFASERSFRESFNKELTERTRKKLTNYGVTVLLAHLTDFSPCTTLNHLGVTLRHEMDE